MVAMPQNISLALWNPAGHHSAAIDQVPTVCQSGPMIRAGNTEVNKIGCFLLSGVYYWYNDSNNVYRTYSMPGSVLNASCILAHVTLRITPCNRFCC